MHTRVYSQPAKLASEWADSGHTSKNIPYRCVGQRLWEVTSDWTSLMRSAWVVQVLMGRSLNRAQLILLATWLIWGFHESVLSRIIPKLLISLTNLTVSPQAMFIPGWSRLLNSPTEWEEPNTIIILVFLVLRERELREAQIVREPFLLNCLRRACRLDVNSLISASTQGGFDFLGWNVFSGSDFWR